jgi:hypothetical protein
MGRAVALARWIGTGRRPVTAGGVLRKADVPAAGAALGVDVPARLRTMADIRALHRPWCVAVATGLLQVDGGWVTAADKRYADVLRGYLRSDTIAPLPLERLAATHPDTVDAVFRKILRQRDFTWAEHGKALMRRRKAWYYEREPRPGVSVIGDRLVELVLGARR